MKKNLLSIVILSLLIVNIVLSAVTMYSVTSTNKKTAAIVTDIANIINLELDSGDDSSGMSAVSLADTEVYSIQDSLTIPLRKEEGDTKDNYCIVSVTLSLNKTDPDYATYQPSLATSEGLIKSEIISVIGSYTLTEAKLSQDQMCEEILQRIQEMYGSKFIYKVSFSEIMYG